MPQTPKEARDEEVNRVVKTVRRGMYRKMGDCECDICEAHNALEVLISMAKGDR